MPLQWVRVGCCVEYDFIEIWILLNLKLKSFENSLLQNNGFISKNYDYEVYHLVIIYFYFLFYC